jgi:hypothetical protein
VRPDDVRDAVRVSSDIGWHIDALSELLKWATARIYIHQVGPDQERFWRSLGERVLPGALKSSASRFSM